MHTYLQLLVQARRSLLRSPGFCALTIVILALGIGASTALFSTAHRVLLERLPYPEPDRLVLLWDGADGARLPATFGTFRELQQRSRSFQAIAATRPWRAALASEGEGEPELLAGQQVSADLFQVLGVAPNLGPGFDPADDLPNGKRTAIISQALWQRHFAADPAVIGRSMRLNQQLYSIVGVMPEGFHNALVPTAEIWTLLQFDPALPADGHEWGRGLGLVARLQPGLSRSAASAELRQIGAQPVPEFARPEHADLAQGVRVLAMQAEVNRELRPGLLAVLGAAVLLLAIACANVANLLLTRGEQRRAELGICVALGASRRRLIAQSLSETLLLTAAGTVLGVLLADQGLRLLAVVAPAGLLQIRGLGLDGLVLVVAVVTAVLVGLLTGLLPAVRAATQHAGSHRSLGRRRRGRHSLVIIEVALATVLLAGASVLLLGMNRLTAVDAGFQPDQLLSLRVHDSARGSADASATAQFHERALAAVRELPGVESAALTQQLPLSGDEESYGVFLQPRSATQTIAAAPALRHSVSADYFSTMGIPLRAGRAIDAGDHAGAPPAAVISASLAAHWFPDSDPIGRSVRIGGAPMLPSYTIVGVAGNVRHASLATTPAHAIYVAHLQWPFGDPTMSFVVRTRGDAAGLPAAIRDTVWSLDRDRPVTRSVQMDALLADSLADLRFVSLLFSVFGLAALALAGTGLYGALAINVAERRGEIALRQAVGARAPAVVSWILGRGMGTAAIGIGLGLLIATPMLHILLFEVSAADLTSFALAALVLACVALAACVVPLQRALRVDPAQALRSE